MEQVKQLGSVAELSISIEAGVAQLSLDASIPSDLGASAGAFIKVDAGVLVDKIFAAIEAKLPPGAQPLEEAVKVVIKNAILAIK